MPERTWSSRVGVKTRYEEQPALHEPRWRHQSNTIFLSLVSERHQIHSISQSDATWTISRTPGKACYHYPIMDNGATAKLCANKDFLDTTEEAERLMLLCNQIYGGNRHSYYRVWYLYLAYFGAKASLFDVPQKCNTPGISCAPAHLSNQNGITFEASAKNSFSRVEDHIFCVLHLRTWII
jgi:hypothetical protein